MTDIISPLPFTLSNGNQGDASQVQAMFDQIVEDVNQNAATRGGGGGSAYVGAMVLISAPQTLNHSTLFPVPFASTAVDTSSIHSDSINNSRLTVPAGIAQVRLIASAGYTDPLQIAGLFIIKNGATIVAGENWLDSSRVSTPLFSIITPLLIVSPTDYFQLRVYNGDGSVNTTIENAAFEMQILG